MSARAEEELPQLPIDSPTAAVPPAAETRLTPEIALPVLDVHPPHESVHTWRGFFIHIATIVIGLFIAVGLEQTVEVFDHRDVNEQLEEQMRVVFKAGWPAMMRWRGPVSGRFLMKRGSTDGKA